MKSNETLQHTISCQNPPKWITVKRTTTHLFGDTESYTAIIDLSEFFRFDIRYNKETNTYIIQGYLRYYNGLSNVHTIYDNIETEEKALHLLYKILSIVEKKEPQSRLMQYVQNQ